MPSSDRVITCRSDPKVKLTNNVGKAMLNVVFETDAPPAQPPAKSIVAALAMPHDTKGEVVMDKIDPRLPVDFRFNNVMSLKDSGKTISCMLLVEIPKELRSVPIHVSVNEQNGTVIASDTSTDGRNISLLFDATIRG